MDGTTPVDGGTPTAGDAPSHPRDYPPPHDGPTIRVPNDDMPAPGPRTPFAPGDGLAPNSVYEVDGRGTFYTDDTGRITYVDTSYGDTSGRNPDLSNPQADTTYVVRIEVDDPAPGVDYSHVFVTNGDGHVVLAHTDALSLGQGSRSPHIQQTVGNWAGPEFEGGHIFAASTQGGGEYINTTAMHEQVNGGSGENSFFNLEGTWRSELNPANRPDGWQPPIIPVTFYFDLPPGSRVADSFEVDYRIGEGPPVQQFFYNGLDQ